MITKLKANFKKILFFLLGVGVVSAAPLLLPGIDINAYEAPPVTFQGKQITFPCKDNQDHTGETVAIRTDDCEIVSWGGDSDNVYTYVAVSNLSQDDQNFQIQGFHSNGSEFVKFEEMKLQVPYQREVDDYSDVTYECAEGWTADKEIALMSTYSCSSLKETKVCKTVEKTTCTVSEKTGSHSETYYVDELGSIIKNPSPDSSLDLASKKREDAKMVLKDQIEYWIPSGQTKYFRAKLKFPKGKELTGKFSVKVFGSMGAIGSIDPSWYSASWGYRRSITVDNTKVGTTTPFTGFPFMFSTSTIADLKFTGSGGHVGKSDGTDILITESDGTTKLPHEIEYYSSSTGETVLWFKSSTSTPISTTTPTQYWVYYGNAAASDQQDATNVWDSDYKGVYHLKESAVSYLDSTSNAYHGTTTSGTVTQVTAQIYKGQNFAANSYISIPNFITAYPVTVEYWATTTVTTNNPQFNIVNTGINVAGGFSGSGAYYYTGVSNKGAATSGFINKEWNHIVVVQTSSSNVTVYTNGVNNSTTTNSSWVAGATSAIGARTTGGFTGKIDEFRVSNTNRSADWIKTEYNNQSSPNTFWSVGSEETDTPAAAPSTRRILIIE